MGVRAFHTNNRGVSAVDRRQFLYTRRSLAMRACVPHKQQGRLCSRPTTISLHKVVPGNACVRSTQITGSSLQSTDDNFSTQGGPWQCVRAFHTNNRVVSAVDRQRFLYTRRSLAMRACIPHKKQGRLCSRPTTISLHQAVPGNACVRFTQITGSSLQSTDNDCSTQGAPWQCVRAFHTNNRVASAVDQQRFL